MQHSRGPTRTGAAVAAALVLLLAACGGDDDEPAAEAPAEEPAAADAPADEPAGDVPISPSALTLADQEGDGTTVTVDAVDLPAPGFIAVHGDGGGSPGPVIGVSDLLPAGTTNGVTVTLDEPLTETGTVFPMVHIDTNSNEAYEFGTVEGVDGPGTTADGSVAVGPVQITLAGGTDHSTDDASSGGTDDYSLGGTTGDGAAGENAITIADFAFSGVTEVPVGTTVTVTNEDGTTHTWSAVDGAFDSGALDPGESFEFTFTEAGTFDYFCNFHPSMTGTIVVTP
jgi:plastocyanin